jgi:ribosomal protein S18 acetylase RimI-like enzyme
MIEVKSLPPERWREARELRLQGLKTDPVAFGSSYEEEENFTEDEWKRRTGNALFAISDDDILVGTITYVFSDRIKTGHIARIFAAYVDPNYRGRGVGKKLLSTALNRIQENKNIVKVQLMVNIKQNAAVALYKSLGFAIVSEMKKELKVDDEFYDEYVMEKML